MSEKKGHRIIWSRDLIKYVEGRAMKRGWIDRRILSEKFLAEKIKAGQN